MLHKFLDLDVDSGSLYLVPVEDIEDYNYVPNDSCFEFTATGNSCRIYVENTWNGEVSETFHLEPGKKYVLGDICYVIKDEGKWGEPGYIRHWSKLLDDTDFLRQYAIRTGGDGGYYVELTELTETCEPRRKRTKEEVEEEHKQERLRALEWEFQDERMLEHHKNMRDVYERVLENHPDDERTKKILEFLDKYAPM